MFVPCLMEKMVAMLHGDKKWRQQKRMRKAAWTDRGIEGSLSLSPTFTLVSRYCQMRAGKQGCEWKWLVEQKDEQRKRRERGNALQEMSTLRSHLASYTFSCRDSYSNLEEGSISCQMGCDPPVFSVVSLNFNISFLQNNCKYPKANRYKNMIPN